MIQLPITTMFREAAALLAGESVPAESEIKARELVVRMGFGHVLESGERKGQPEAAAFFNVAARMSRIFSLGSPDAPGLACVDGTVDPAAYDLPCFEAANVSGRGLNIHQAFKSCIGEGVEYLSQLEWGDEAVSHADGSVGDAIFDAFLPMPGASDPACRGLSLMPAQSLVTGKSSGVPVKFCLRSRGDARDHPPPLRTGCAAGETKTQATLAALLELVERDAAALWWIGGRRGRAIADETLQAGGISSMLGTLRQGNRSGRRTWLLDITTDLDIPCAVAMSTDAAGAGFTFGLGASLTLEAAAQTAIQELCQMEVAHHLIALKLRHGGEAALTEGDRHHRRVGSIDSARCELLFPADTARMADASASDDPEAQLVWLTERLATRSIESFVVDLTRKAIGIPAVRVLAPELQSLPSRFATGRLRAVIERTGGADHYTAGIDLL